MYLWSRQLTLRPGSFVEGGAALAGVMSHINANTSYDFSLWQSLLGAPLGSFAVTTRFESYGAFTDEIARVYAEDADYVAMVDAAGVHLAANPEDSLWNVIHTVGDMSEVPNVALNFAWQANPAEVAASAAWAVEFATYAQGLGGGAGSVSISNWGVTNGVRMVWGYDSVAELEERNGVSMADPGIGERIVASADVGIPLNFQSAVARRIL